VVPLSRIEYPTGRGVLVLEFGPPLSVADSSGVWERRQSGFFAGIDDGASLTEFAGAQAGVQVNLTLKGAHAFLATPMHEVARRVMGLRELGVTPSLAERLAEARNWSARFGVVVEFLQLRLGRSPPLSDLVSWAASRIDASGGAVRIDELAKELGYSRKHLHACFLREVGLSPKRYAEVMRFDGLRRRLLANGTTGLADLAAELGYADQAHMTRDARRFSSMSPTTLQKALRDPLACAVHALSPRGR
jgi:AraC-like DNA-binding protein